MTDETRILLVEALTAIPGAYAQLADYVLPGTRPPDPNGHQGKKQGISDMAVPRDLLNLDVLDLLDIRSKPDADACRRDYDRDRRAGARRQGVLPTLSAWVLLADSELCDEGVEHGEPSDQPTVAGECDWLLGQIDWLTGRSWAADLAAEARVMLRDIRRAIGEKIEENPTCPSCKWPVVPRDKKAWYGCTGCNRTWVMHSEINRLFADQAYTATLRECAELVGRPRRTLSDWSAWGWIAPVAKDKRGRWLYDTRQVERAAAEIRQGKRTERAAS